MIVTAQLFGKKKDYNENINKVSPLPAATGHFIYLLFINISIL